MVSTHEGITENIPILLSTPEPVKNTGARKSLYQFSEVLDAKHRTDVHRLGATK